MGLPENVWLPKLESHSFSPLSCLYLHCISSLCVLSDFTVCNSPLAQLNTSSENPGWLIYVGFSCTCSLDLHFVHLAYHSGNPQRKFLATRWVNLEERGRMDGSSHSHTESAWLVTRYHTFPYLAITEECILYK